MTNKEFCYWLQGYFELAKPVDLTKENAITIRKHIELVSKVERLEEFPAWLSGILDATQSAISNDMTNTIKSKLSLKFKHEIDLSYPKNKELNRIHGSSKPDTYRC